MTSRLAGSYERAEAIPSRTLGTVLHFSLRPLFLKFGAATFLVAMTAYSVGLIYYMRHAQPAASFGATYEFVVRERAIHLAKVAPSGPAARAGLRSNDRIVAVNGRSLSSVYPFWDSVERGWPTQIVRLAVQRAGDSTIEEVPVTLDANPVSNQIGRALLTPPRLVALQILSFYPVPFLVVAGVVLIQRFHDRNAWLLAVMFAGFVVGTQLPMLEPIIHPALRKPLLAYWVLWAAAAPGALYYFFSSFPEPTPLDRRLPWLKVVFLGLPLVTGAALAVVTLGSTGRPFHLVLGPTARAYLDFVLGIYTVLGYGLGLVSLVLNSFVAKPETRRRTRVMLWGTAGAVLPFLILGSYAVYRGMEFIELPFWLWIGAIFAIFLLPLSFAYAVVKHRVMEIPVLLRRSARYVVVRHSIVVVGIAIGVALTFAFAALFSRVLSDGPERRALSGVVGAMFGVLVAVATRSGVSQVTQRLDRAFFREAYDARQLLQNLARRTRDATDPRQLAELLERSLREALHPATILVLLRTPADRLEVVTPAGNELAALDAVSVDRETFVRFGAIPVKRGELPSALTPLAVVEPELIAAMQGHDEQVEGLLVFGARLSDEPYGAEDRELVASVASQAGIALQNLRLASAIAERMEAERRASRDLEIAREVQAMLLPQHAPPVESLEYAGVCIQAKQVGGDYYDFLYLGPGRFGLALADVSGKGISAALLMANLQATLRSHYAQAPDDLPRVLRTVNETFFESTVSSRYATLFFAVYDERTARLQYANCGHLPPVLLRSSGSIERLPPTASVIGLFEAWNCSTRDVELTAGDTLVMFTDGVVEAFNAEQEEYGEERLVNLLREQIAQPVERLVDAVVRSVQQHSGPEQSDDLTLVVLRRRESAIH